MKEKEIIDGNTMIHEWMGHRRMKSKGWGHCWIGAEKAEDLQYHTSWDRLMPVVEKIGGLANVRIHVGLCSITMKAGDALIYKKKHGVPFDEIPPYAECNTSTFIGNVWHAAVDFIKWHNTKSK